jgi:hypothetical protein
MPIPKMEVLRLKKRFRELRFDPYEDDDAEMPRVGTGAASTP